jgi:hypothetical protein
VHASSAIDYKALPLSSPLQGGAGMADDVRTTLRRALTRLNSEKVRIDRQISTLETVLSALSGRVRQTRRVRRRMSVAARRAIGRRMKAYWAKRKLARATKK